jgi:hypothetical protein
MTTSALRPLRSHHSDSVRGVMTPENPTRTEARTPTATFHALIRGVSAGPRSELAVEQGYEIVHPPRDEEWGVRRFMLREPSGTVVNVVSHRSD